MCSHLLRLKVKRKTESTQGSALSCTLIAPLRTDCLRHESPEAPAAAPSPCCSVYVSASCRFGKSLMSMLHLELQRLLVESWVTPLLAEGFRTRPKDAGHRQRRATADLVEPACPLHCGPFAAAVPHPHPGGLVVPSACSRGIRGKFTRQPQSQLRAIGRSGGREPGCEVGRLLHLPCLNSG